MARPCSICTRPDRAAIDAALLAGSPFRNIQKCSGTSLGALWRHRSEHLAEQLAAAAEARRAEHPPGPDRQDRLDGLTDLPHTIAEPPAPPERRRRQDTAEALDVLGQLKAVNAATLRVLADARASGDGRLVLQAADRVQKQIELQAKLLGQLDERPTVNVYGSPDWLALEAALLDVLTRFPDARYAVVDRLTELRRS